MIYVFSLDLFITFFRVTNGSIRFSPNMIYIYLGSVYIGTIFIANISSPASGIISKVDCWPDSDCIFKLGLNGVHLQYYCSILIKIKY